MFEAYYTGVKPLLKPVAAFHPFPRIADRKAWQGLTKEHKAFLLEKAEPYLNYAWPVPQAKLYMDFYRDGNRTRYENLTFYERRIPLLYLVMAECMENKGRFLEDIINGIWTTLEETTWVVPAHNNHGKPPIPLPETPERDEDNYVDLFCAECGAVIAWIYYQMHEKLDAAAPQVSKRMLSELKRRIFLPFITHDDFIWMNPPHMNNWCPWVCSNCMLAASVACMDEDLRAAVFEKAFRLIEKFVAIYSPDGGCDEGPCYWGAAGGALYDCLDIAYDVSDGKINFFNEPLIHNMCSYIAKMHIDRNYFVCYADADAKTPSFPSLIYCMGERFADSILKKLGAALYTDLKDYVDPRAFVNGGHRLYRTTKGFFLDKKLSKSKCTYPYVRDAYLPGIQVMAARTQKGKREGLFLSAKGGHNGESHNHNDVGSFVVFSDGQPAIMDIGRGNYTKFTFNDQRYTIPMMQSAYHNLPMVNGVGQHNGKEYTADRVQYEEKPDLITFSLGIEKAYEASAGIKKWDRAFRFDRKENVITVTDGFSLERKSEVQFVLMLAQKPTVKGNVLTVKSEGRPLAVTFDERLACKVELFDCSWDSKLTLAWGKTLYRAVFTTKEVQSGTFTMTVTQK